MQNFKMICKKRFQFTFWSEILSKSKYLMITKSLLNWMNWIPRGEISILNGIDLILHITTLRHADEDIVLAQNATKSQNEGGLGQLSLQYKYSRYSRVSGLNDLGLIPLYMFVESLDAVFSSLLATELDSWFQIQFLFQTKWPLL